MHGTNSGTEYIWRCHRVGNYIGNPSIPYPFCHFHTTDSLKAASASSENIAIRPMLIPVQFLRQFAPKQRTAGAGSIQTASISTGYKTPLICNYIISSMAYEKVDFVICPGLVFTHPLILWSRRDILVKSLFIFQLFWKIKTEPCLICSIYLGTFKTSMNIIMTYRLISPFFNINIGV